ncbi:tyrosine-type recombinase/integrase [Isoptericola rhizosphaerae]|uniref:tyrosine-type recombinase/integrase n=1 Tax=Isoptericola rhizosphaerae TaxID=3377837 RepID=UPI00383B9035
MRGADGRPRSRSFDRKTDARRWEEEQRTALASGEWVDPAAGRVTFGEYADRWLKGRHDLKPTTRAGYTSTLRLADPLASVPLAKVTHEAVAEWVADLVARDLSASHVRSAHVLVHAVLDGAVRARRLATNPATGVPVPKHHRRRRMYLTESQAGTLAAAVGRWTTRKVEDGTTTVTERARPDTATCDQMHALVLVLAFTGLRFGEAVALRGRHVDLLRRRIRVEEAVTEVGGRQVYGPPKNGEARDVPVPGFLVDILQGRITGADDHLFATSAGTPLRAGNVRRLFDPAATAVGLPGLHLHDLRHTAASLAVSAGANVKAVQAMLGHKSAAMTLDVYADLFPQDLDDVARRLDERWRSQDVARMSPEPSPPVVGLRTRETPQVV